MNKVLCRASLAYCQSHLYPWKVQLGLGKLQRTLLLHWRASSRKGIIMTWVSGEVFLVFLPPEGSFYHNPLICMELIVRYRGSFIFFFKKARNILEKILCLSRIFLNTVALRELFPAILNFEVGIFIILNSYYIMQINIHMCICTNLRKYFFPLFWASQMIRWRFRSHTTKWEQYPVDQSARRNKAVL